MPDSTILTSAGPAVVLTTLKVVGTLLAGPILGQLVRRGLTKAGLRPPRADEPGLDWARFIGLVVSVATLMVLLPTLLPDETAARIRPVISAIVQALGPLAPAVLILTLGDHYRRGLLESAETTTRDERAVLTERADLVQKGMLLAAALSVLGDGLWVAWPLGLGFVLWWAMRDPTIRPIFDRVVGDLRAGFHLRSRASWMEGTPVVLGERSGELAGAVGLLDTRVRIDDGIEVIRNVVLMQTLPTPRASALSGPKDAE